MLTFDTARTERRERVAEWNCITERTFGPIAIAPLDAERFRGRLHRRTSGSVGLAAVTSSAAIVQGAWHGAEALPGHFLLLNESGSAWVEQAGTAVELGGGQLTAIRADRGYRIEFSDDNHMLVTHVTSAPRGVDWALATGHARTAAEDPALIALLRQWSADPRGDGPPGAYARALNDLLGLSWLQPAPSGGAREEWLERIVDHIETHLLDPDLSAHTIGRALGASGRYVQMTLASAGTTSSRMITEGRLDLAADLLIADRDRSVARIAFDVGFGDVTSFCRAFRRRFECTATQWRTRH